MSEHEVHREPATGVTGEFGAYQENIDHHHIADSAERAREVVATLKEYGISEVVYCPGSRNAPLGRQLHATSGMRVHVRLDERAAGFLALGLSRATGVPVPVVMTSGTAVANVLPAAIEAYHAGVPFIILSADRPRRLVGTGASQTINQDGLFGMYAPTFSADVGHAVRPIVELGLVAGNSHINIAFDNPLVLPVSDITDVPLGTYRHPRTDHGTTHVDLSRNTLVIAGDGAWEIPELYDVPTIAEPTAPAPYYPVHPLAGELFLKAKVTDGSLSADTAVEQVIVVGHPTLHREVMKLIKYAPHLIVLSQHPEPTDPFLRADAVASRITTTGAPTSAWLRVTASASSVAAEVVRETLAEDHGFTGLHVAAAIADSLAPGDVLFSGASNPIRDLSLVGLPFTDVTTYSPRGAAGIDGTIAQAIGVALATQRRDPFLPAAPRALALMGDLTFLHDATSLNTMTDEVEDLTIVVANDNGGGIFEWLEAGAPEYRDSFEHTFGTPHDVSIADLASAFGVPYAKVTSLSALQDLLADGSYGLRVIEATTQRDTRRALHEAIAKKMKWSN